MGNNNDPNQKQRGEKEPGKFHYNPGNMSGKTISIDTDEAEKSNADKSRGDQQDTKTKTPAITDKSG